MADPLQEISLENAGGAACDVFELSQVSQHPGQCHQSPTKLVLAEQSGYQKHHPNVIAAATAIRQPASTSIRIVLFGMRPPSSAWDISFWDASLVPTLVRITAVTLRYVTLPLLRLLIRTIFLPKSFEHGNEHVRIRANIAVLRFEIPPFNEGVLVRG